MIITPYSVFYSIVWGSICLIFLRLVYRFLLRHNCFKLVLFFSFLVIFRFLFVIDLPVVISDGPLYSISKSITIWGKRVFDFVPAFSLRVLTERSWINIGKLLLIIWFTVAIILIVKDWIAIKLITKASKVTQIPGEYILAEQVLQHIQKDMNIGCDIKIIQNSYIQVPFVRGLLHPIIYLNKSCIKEDELYAILRHELTHIVYHDNWLKVVFHYSRLLLWWNPSIMLLTDIIDDACEYRCDNVVTECMDDLSKLNYASLLNRYSKVDVLNSSFLITGSTYAYKKEKDHIFQRISAFLKPEPLKLPTKFIYFIVIIVISMGSLTFSLPTVTQDRYMPTTKEDVEITSENSYILKNANGSYSLYSYGMLIDNDLTDISIYNIPIEEEER